MKKGIAALGIGPGEAIQPEQLFRWINGTITGPTQFNVPPSICGFSRVTEYATIG